MRGGAEEREDGGVRLCRPLPQLLGRDDQQLLAREDGQPSLELLRVAPAGGVRVVPPRAAERSGVGGQPLGLAARPLLLGGERLLERERLAA